MMNPDRRPTIREAAVATLKSWWWVLLSTGGAFGWAGWAIHKSMETASGDIISDTKLLLMFGGMTVFFCLFAMYLGISMRVDTPTRAEREEGERDLARRLLKKYPDLLDEPRG